MHGPPRSFSRSEVQSASVRGTENDGPEVFPFRWAWRPLNSNNSFILQYCLHTLVHMRPVIFVHQVEPRTHSTSLGSENGFKIGGDKMHSCFGGGGGGASHVAFSALVINFINNKANETNYQPLSYFTHPINIPQVYMTCCKRDVLIFTPKQSLGVWKAPPGDINWTSETASAEEQLTFLKTSADPWSSGWLVLCSSDWRKGSRVAI